MAVKIRLGGEWIDPSQCRIRQAGSWRAIKQIQIYSGGAWRTVANFTGASGGSSGGMTLEIQDAGGGSFTQAAASFSHQYQARVSGGDKPWTYQWSVLSESGASFAFVDDSRAKITVTATLAAPGEATATLECVCTDSLGTEASATVEVTFTRT